MIDGHKPNHTCLACGKEYWACDSCDKKISKTWRMACCTEDHYKAYLAMWSYGQGQIKREEARDVLKAQDALSWEKAPGRALIEEIMAEDTAENKEEPEQEQPREEPAKAGQVQAQPNNRQGYYGKKKKHW